MFLRGTRDWDPGPWQIGREARLGRLGPSASGSSLLDDCLNEGMVARRRIALAGALEGDSASESVEDLGRRVKDQ